MGTFLKVGGSIVTALSTITSIILNIRETASLFGYPIDWKWLTLASFVFFLGFIIWWIYSLESKWHAKPTLKFTESRESPFFDRTTGQAKYRGLQVWFVNKPKISTDDSVAKDVTAKITFYSIDTKEEKDIYGVFVLGEAFEFAGYTDILNKIDTIPPNDEPCKLQIALKWEKDESAYAFAKESFIHSQTGDGREPARELIKGSHYVKVHISGTRVSQPPFWFLLNNPGKDGQLSLSNPIKKPDLRKAGFYTE